MADFIPTTVSKNAIRVLRSPLPSLMAFSTIVNGVVSTNPWGCIPYTRSGANMPPIEITREVYSGKVHYQDPMGKIMGTVTVNAQSQAGFTSAVAEVLGSTDLETAIGGTPAHDPMMDTYSSTLRCCAADGDLYTVPFTRKQVRVASYHDDAVLNTLEVWADGISQLD